MSSPYLIKGGIYKDKRGVISFVNDFMLDNIKRFYIITHTDSSVVRAWQGHKFESKYFYCLKGNFLVNLVKIDDWSNPTMELDVITYNLEAEISQVLFIPPGYANGFKATLKDSQLLVYSDKTTEESKVDDYRYDSNYWFNWQKI